LYFIDAGIFGVPHEVVARAAYQAVMKFDNVMSKETLRYLKVIKFVNIDHVITDCMKAVFGELHDKGSNRSQNGRSESASPRDESGDAVPVVTPRMISNSKTLPEDATNMCAFCTRRYRSLTQRSCGHNCCSGCMKNKCLKCLGKPFAKVIPATNENADFSAGGYREQQQQPLSNEGKVSGDSNMSQWSAAGGSSREFLSLPVTSKSDKMDSNDKHDTTSSLMHSTGDGSNTKLHVPASDDLCVICQDKITDEKKLDCGHRFCRVCIDQSFKHQKKCPSCGRLFGAMKGDQPDGTMRVEERTTDVDGYPGCGSIQIYYNIPTGIQTVN